MSEEISNLIWVEKWRPKVVADCCLPPRIKKVFQQSLKDRVMHNMTLAGPAGVGKTSAAKALMNELGMDVLVINASENGNIDTIRTTVRQFGSGMSFSGNLRGVILDEGDYLTPLAQASLRGMMEELSANCRFVITANFANKIIEPILSRAPLIDFTYDSDEKIEAIVAADERIRMILKTEGVNIPIEAEEAFSGFVMRHFPDMRAILNLMQRASANGSLDWEALNGSHDLYDYQGLMEALKSKSFDGIRAWVAENVDRDGASIRRHIFNMLDGAVVPEAMPGIILHLAEYDYKESFVVDREINTLAMLLSIAADAEFR